MSGRGTGSAPSRQAALKAAVLIKTGKKSLKGIWFLNLDSAAAYIQVFDAAAATDVTLGTTTPDIEFAIKASEHNHIDGHDLQFTKGIVAASTTAAKGNTSGTNGVHCAFMIGD